MFKGFTSAAAAVALIAAMAPMAAEAHPRGWGASYGDRYRPGDYYRGGYGGYYGRDYGRPSRHYRSHRTYRCDSGTGGTIIGAIAGGLLGNEIAKNGRGRDDGTTGAIIGAGVGALAGRAIDRDC